MLKLYFVAAWKKKAFYYYWFQGDKITSRFESIQSVRERTEITNNRTMNEDCGGVEATTTTKNP